MVSVVFDMKRLNRTRKGMGLTTLEAGHKILGYPSKCFRDLILNGGRCENWSLIQDVVLWYGGVDCFSVIEPELKELLLEILLDR